MAEKTDTSAVLLAICLRVSQAFALVVDELIVVVMEWVGVDVLVLNSITVYVPVIYENIVVLVALEYRYIYFGSINTFKICHLYSDAILLGLYAELLETLL